MPDNRHALLAASLIGDSLALGAHWEYSQAALVQAFGRVENLEAPRPGSYHPTKQAGQFTHYGDQTMVLLESLAANGGQWRADDFFDRWQALFDGYGGYIDGATRHTLTNIQAGAGPDSSGSPSNDLAGAARLAPLAFFAADRDRLIAAAREQTAMTHTDGMVVDAAGFFARTVWDVLAGADPAKAMEEAASARYDHLPADQWTAAGLEWADADSPAAVKSLGQTCHADHAFPSVVQLIARHAMDTDAGLENALIDNAMAGGDSAARGLLVGTILGAAQGWQAIPDRWWNGLRARARIEELWGE